jgi:hypothetical protein
VNSEDQDYNKMDENNNIIQKRTRIPWTVLKEKIQGQDNMQATNVEDIFNHLYTSSNSRIEIKMETRSS